MKKKATKKAAGAKARRSRTKDLPAKTAAAVRGGTTLSPTAQPSSRSTSGENPTESISFAYQKVKVGY